MSTTTIEYHIGASRAKVYQALVDEHAVQAWKVPTGMSSQVHEFDASEGGKFRVSLTYDSPTGTGKTTSHTDTYHGYFARLIPDEQVVEVVEFETDDPTMTGEMRISITLTDAPGGGTRLLALHEQLPPGVSPADNELGWRSSLAKLAQLVQTTRCQPR